MANRKNGFITTDGLKIIACITMLIDHIGYAFFPSAFLLRFIGRIAMPIYCFLITEGAVHTSNKLKYLGRMFFFTCLSEIPFNMLVSESFFDLNNQSVMVTLTCGLIFIYMGDILSKKINSPVKYLPIAIIFILICILTELLKTDYGFIGISMIAVFWLFKKNIRLTGLGLFVVNCFFYMISIHSTKLPVQTLAVLAIIPVYFYNGQKGKLSQSSKNGTAVKIVKYCFYLFYPLHLFILGIIKMYLI